MRQVLGCSLSLSLSLSADSTIVNPRGEYHNNIFFFVDPIGCSLYAVAGFGFRPLLLWLWLSSIDDDDVDGIASIQNRRMNAPMNSLEPINYHRRDSDGQTDQISCTRAIHVPGCDQQLFH